MSGRRPKLAIDVILTTDEQITTTHKEYISNWKEEMPWTKDTEERKCDGNRKPR